MTAHAQLDIFTGESEICNTGKDPTRSGLEEMEDRLMARYVEKVGAVISSLDDIGLPGPGQQYRLVTRRSFNAVELIQYIVRTEKILDLSLAIYSINFQAAKVLIHLVDTGRIGHIRIMMSNLRNKAHREKEEIIKNDFTAHPKVELFFCCSHAKMMCCKTDAGNYYAIEGSGNLAYNSRVEQYIIDNDRMVYEFSLSWMAEIKEFLKGKKELEIC